MSDYCGTEPATEPNPEPTLTPAAGPPFAACVLCQEPTEYPESYKGITLCPVCEWREAERNACSG
ncbi:hypothetical protein [Streptomyces capitiformicae]|uniref:Uncharacterized protein n=1 Tax=Streptomyces capitiformicae TaxID=2014920 RepID=A0A919GB35_9ACTN|nr:hypothetical protein [Streptomyces capitiformicae]GHH81245.1 hypothetical protein GCM10017771_02670 [Streptomyces capitiformicae]